MKGYNMETVTYTQFAKLRGVSQPMVSKYIKIGAITPNALVKVGAHFRIIPEIAKRDLEKYFAEKPVLGGYGDLKTLDDIDRLLKEISQKLGID